MALRRAGKGYVLGVSGASQFNSRGTEPVRARTAAVLAGELDETGWQRLSAGEGTTGARLYDWAYCALADLDAADYDGPAGGSWTRGLLIRRAIADGDLHFFSTWCPAGTDIATLVRVEGQRWTVEDSFEVAKNEWLDDNESRSWHGWHRYIWLVMLAFAMMAAVRPAANAAAPPKRPARAIGCRLN